MCRVDDQHTMLPEKQAFDHQPARVKERLLLESTCLRCGESRLVSAADGTLEDWEDTHLCAKRPVEKAETVPTLSIRRRFGNAR